MSAGIVRLQPFWAAVAARLDSARMRTILGGVGRVTRAGLTPFNGGEAAQWGRIILTPRTQLWPDSDTRGLTQYVAWLVTVEMNGYQDPAYDPLIPLEAAQGEALTQLQGFVPGPFATGAGHARVVTPIWRESVPQSTPQWDEEDGVWWLSAEYRCEVTGHFT